MALKVAITTTPGELFHKYFCATIASRFDVVGVLHPNPARKSARLLDLAAHKRAIRKYGLVHHLLSKLGSNKLKSVGWDLAKDVAEAESEFFPDAAADYQAKVASRARLVEDINGPEGVDLLRSLDADVVVNSGGPIYRKPVLKAARLMLNFHTGVSPIYNGSESAFWTFANGQPHVTGGTLMVMNAGVDAGDMLAHYMPPVEPGDTPGRQFIKTIMGGVDLYCRFLGHLEAGKPFVGAPQGRPFHYTVSADWSVHQNLSIERHIRQGICKKYARPEIVSIYWDQPDEASAKRVARAFLAGIIFDA
jgi:methionyl-tRNA formyltransferase